MFQPKRTKYRKQQKGRNTGNAQRGATLSFGTYGLKATQRGQLTSRQIEAARRAMTRHIWSSCPPMLRQGSWRVTRRACYRRRLAEA